MPTQGPNFCGTAVSDNSAGGTVVWSNPSNVTASDDTRATTAAIVSTFTEYLKCTNFGFSIPTGATIVGILVQVEKRYGTPSPQDRHRRLIKAGTIQSTDASAGSWNAADTVDSYGGLTDLWGGTWTYSDINDSGFGFALSAQGASGTCEVDSVKITVAYTETTPPKPVIAAPPEMGREWPD